MGAAIAEMGRQLRGGVLRGQQGLVAGVSVPSLIIACGSGRPVLLPGTWGPAWSELPKRLREDG